MPWQTQGLYSPVITMNSNFKRQQIKKHKTLQTNYESAGSSQEFFYFHFHHRWLTIFKHRIHITWENKNKHQHPLDTPGSVFSALYFLTPEVLLISFKIVFKSSLSSILKQLKFLALTAITERSFSKFSLSIGLLISSVTVILENL